LASTLKEVADGEAMGLRDTSLFNLVEEDPVRNLDFELMHGLKTAADACVVTVAIFSHLNFGQENGNSGGGGDY